MMVARASRDLMHEFRVAVMAQVKSWTLNDVLRCNSSPVYTGLANLAPEQALAKSEFHIALETDAPHPLTFDSPDAPDFCKRAQFIVSPDNKILGFEVSPSAAETLDLAELMQQADQFTFSGGKDTSTGTIYFTAQSKDEKIQYTMQGRLPILVRVKYLY
jgi:hypothetical protein